MQPLADIYELYKYKSLVHIENKYSSAVISPFDRAKKYSFNSIKCVSSLVIWNSTEYSDGITEYSDGIT